MKKENAETAFRSLTEHQKKYGDEALTTSERAFLSGSITWEQFKIQYTEIDPWRSLGFTDKEYAEVFFRDMDMQ